jgi:hypothetical protein
MKILLVIASSLLLLAGCATPPAIKTASKTQCELIGELDQSLQALKGGLAQFEEDNQEQIRQVGRVLIAKQAINVIKESGGIATTNGMLGVDDLFKTSNDRVRPFVDYAFLDAELTNAIAQKTKAMNAESNPILKNLLLVDLNELKLRQATLIENRPKDVTALEDILQNEISAHEKTEQTLKTLLETVRAQTGLMKVIATTIDAWLQQDVTVTKAQADNLETAILNGQKAIGGAK